MNEYRIEKLRRAVTVVQCDGSRRDGDIFVRSHARLHDGPEDPLDHLNDETTFFALSCPDGEVLLLAKDQIAWVEVPAPPADTSLSDSPLPGLSVEVTLEGGRSMKGCVFPETRADRARLLDFLNSYTPPFLSVFGRDCTWLVNRRMIAHVKQLS